MKSMNDYGERTIALIEDVFVSGVEHAAVLIRHSAREFEPGRHDLENPLTDTGRALARDLGAKLPKPLLVRAYSSPTERCMETAALVLEGHATQGGEVTRHRPVEALGVFYVLDQMKMYRAMMAASGQLAFLEDWFSGEVAPDIMMPAPLAARLIMRVIAEKLNQRLGKPQLDLCVSHDMTLYTVRQELLNQGVEEAGEVEFLDGLVLYEERDQLWLHSHVGRRPLVID